MPLRNIPNHASRQLADLIATHPGHVSSISFTQNAGFDLMLLSFAEGESVSEEEYYGDVLYYVVEGSCVIDFEQRHLVMHTGEILMVKAHEIHAVRGEDGCAFKLLQLMAAPE